MGSGPLPESLMFPALSLRPGRHARRRAARSPLWKRVLTGLLFLVMTALVASLGASAAGLAESGTIVSGSMRPVLHPGDLVIAIPSDDVQVGDIVMFARPDQPEHSIAHRVVEASPGGLVTAGDANGAPDPWLLDPNGALAVVTVQVPLVGYAFDVLRSRAGIGLTLILPSLVLLVGEIRLWYRFVRHGAEAFTPRLRGRHRAAGVPT